MGWLVQESGDDEGALWWTDRAVGLAEAGGDDDLAAYALVRRALIAFYRDDARQTVGLAGKAQHDGLPPRIRGLAAQQQAQGHALAGDHAACMRSLEKARRLLERDEPGDGPVIGSSNLPDQVSMIHGWCLHDLGRPQEAAAVLDVQTGQVPVHARRARGLRHFFVDAATTIGRAEAVDDLRGRFAPPAGDLSDDQEDGKGDGTVD